jgi:hypothetical protein
MKAEDHDADPVEQNRYLVPRDSLDLMLRETGEVHIESLGQLLVLTRAIELEYLHISMRRRRD